MNETYLLDLIIFTANECNYEMSIEDAEEILKEHRELLN